MNDISIENGIIFFICQSNDISDTISVMSPKNWNFFIYRSIDESMYDFYDYNPILIVFIQTELEDDLVIMLSKYSVLDDIKKIIFIKDNDIESNQHIYKNLIEHIFYKRFDIQKFIEKINNSFKIELKKRKKDYYFLKFLEDKAYDIIICLAYITYVNEDNIYFEEKKNLFIKILRLDYNITSIQKVHKYLSNTLDKHWYQIKNEIKPISKIGLKIEKTYLSELIFYLSEDISSTNQSSIIHFKKHFSIQDRRKSNFRRKKVVSEQTTPNRRIGQIDRRDLLPNIDNQIITVLLISPPGIISSKIFQFLENLNFVVKKSSTEEESFKIINCEKIDLILLESELPTMSGYLLAKILREKISSEIPIIYLMQYCKEINLEDIFESGTDYIVRPFSKTGIIGRLYSHKRVIINQRLVKRLIPNYLIETLGRNSVYELETADYTEKRLCIFFCDIRRFTSMCEKMITKDIFLFLNYYLSQIASSIREFGGHIDKYMGDGIMGFFESADNALDASINILEKIIPNYNSAREERGRQKIEIGISLHYGSVGIGALGESERFDISIVGDSVNVSSRIESLTKDYAPLLMSYDFVSILKKEYEIFQIKENVILKGHSKPVSLYTIRSLIQN